MSLAFYLIEGYFFSPELYLLLSHCEIDGEEEVRVVPFIPHGVVYRPNSRPVILTLVVLEAVHPPPEGPLEDADIEDEDDCKLAPFLPSKINPTCASIQINYDQKCPN